MSHVTPFRLHFWRSPHGSHSDCLVAVRPCGSKDDDVGDDGAEEEEEEEEEGESRHM